MAITEIQANGITLAIEDTGPKDAPPVILIRGQGSQMAHWPRALVDGFVNAGLRVIAFDNRDVGLSQRCPDPNVPASAEAILERLQQGQPRPAAYGLDDMAGDVVGLMDALDVGSAHIFGISLGGMITQQLMIAAPERLRSAIIVMSSCRPTTERFEAGGASPDDLIRNLLSYPVSREDYIASQIQEHALWGSPGFPMPEAMITATAELAFDRGVDADGKNRQILAMMHAPDRRPLLAQSKLPCLVIHGEDDRLLPLELGQEIAATIPGSQFVPVMGMGHIITTALAPLIVEHVRGFVL